MNSLTIVCLFAMVAVVFCRPEEGKYTDKYDNINLDEILSNRRLLLPYFKCIMDEGVCTAEGKELKEHVRDGLETECAKCTEAQKGGVNRVIGHLIKHEQELWKKLTDKYDSEKKFATKYEARLREITA